MILAQNLSVWKWATHNVLCTIRIRLRRLGFVRHALILESAALALVCGIVPSSYTFIGAAVVVAIILRYHLQQSSRNSKGRRAAQQEEHICALCLDAMGIMNGGSSSPAVAMLISCGHCYHQSCWNEYQRQAKETAVNENACPYCRQSCLFVETVEFPQTDVKLLDQHALDLVSNRSSDLTQVLEGIRQATYLLCKGDHLACKYWHEQDFVGALSIAMNHRFTGNTRLKRSSVAFMALLPPENQMNESSLQVFVHLLGGWNTELVRITLVTLKKTFQQATTRKNGELTCRRFIANGGLPGLVSVLKSHLKHSQVIVPCCEVLYQIGCLASWYYSEAIRRAGCLSALAEVVESPCIHARVASTRALNRFATLMLQSHQKSQAND